MGRAYYVMEHVEGEPIDEYIRRNKLPLHDILNLIDQICEAIEHAHERAIIHRNIKPNNILVFKHNEEHCVKIINFREKNGVSNIADIKLNSLESLKMSLRDIAYFSPEQIEGESKYLDHRTDIYSIGVMMYELITDHTPLNFMAALKAGFETIGQVILKCRPHRPSNFYGSSESGLSKLKDVKQSVRNQIDEVCLTCMRKRREKRYQSIGELRNELKRLMGEKITNASMPPQYIPQMDHDDSHYVSPNAVDSGKLIFTFFLIFGSIFTVIALSMSSWVRAQGLTFIIICAVLVILVICVLGFDYLKLRGDRDYYNKQKKFTANAKRQIIHLKDQLEISNEEIRELKNEIKSLKKQKDQ